MIKARYPGGDWFRVQGVVDDAFCGEWHLVGMNCGYDIWWILVRADSLESAIDAYVESDHGKGVRISDDEIEDYLCEECKDGDYDHCSGCRYHITGQGVNYDTDWIEYGSDVPLEIDWFAKAEEP